MQYFCGERQVDLCAAVRNDVVKGKARINLLRGLESGRRRACQETRDEYQRLESHVEAINVNKLRSSVLGCPAWGACGAYEAWEA